MMDLQVVLNSDALEFGGLGRIDETVGPWLWRMAMSCFVDHSTQVEHFTSPDPFNNRFFPPNN